MKLFKKLLTPTELEQALESFVITIKQAAWLANTPKSSLLPLTPRYTHYIWSIIREKRGAKKICQLSRTPRNKTTCNRLNNELKILIKQLKNQSFESHILKLYTQDGSLFNKTRRVLKQHTFSAPLHCSDGSLVISESDKACFFALYHSNTFAPHPNVSNPVHSSFVCD